MDAINKLLAEANKNSATQPLTGIKPEPEQERLAQSDIVGVLFGRLRQKDASKLTHNDMIERKLCVQALANPTKNKYSNLFPFDSTLVPLPSKSFINASFVQLHQAGRKPWIITQAPTDQARNFRADTKADFWEMVVSQDITTIVTLCGEEECAKYWPSQSQSISIPSLQLTVTNTAITPEDSHTPVIKRDMAWKREQQPSQQQQQQDNSEGAVTQLHFVAWDNYGVAQVEALVKLIELVHQAESTSNGTLCMHCSGGVGRSGSFATMLHLYQLMLANGPEAYNDDLLVDTISRVRQMRHPWAVETFDQFELCHTVVNYIRSSMMHKQGN